MQESFQVRGQIGGIARSETHSGRFRHCLPQSAVIAGDDRLAAGLRLDCRHAEHFQFARGHDEDVAGVVDAGQIGIVQRRQIDAAAFLHLGNQGAGFGLPNRSQGPATTSAAGCCNMR